MDIETFVDPTNERSGLNPYQNESKIIAIAYNYHNSFILTENDIHSPTILKEWENGEKKILTEFYDFLKNKNQNDKHLKLVGFNHIKFDVPYLFGRLLNHNIDESQNIHYNLYKSHHIDLCQLGMVTSQRMKKRKEFYNVSYNDVNRFFNLKTKESGTKVSSYYENKDFDKIEDYIINEFNFEELYILLRRHIHQKKTMIYDSEKK